MGVTSNLDRYRYISALGSGGMSTVVLAEDTLLGRRVALKRMIDVSADMRDVPRLRREALIGASLSHPNLVSIYDIVTAEDGEQVIVMEYVDGETLADALSGAGRPEVSAMLPVLDGVGSALDAIHAEGIVHRDVKPANILLGTDGTVKLADLGIAAMPDRTKITTDGAVLGTFSYMAPEQLGGEEATPAVDVYALSAVAFEALSGRKARNEANPVALAHAISTRPPPDLRTAWPEAPAGAAELLIRGMAQDPSERPRSAGELTRRLRAAVEPRAASAAAAERPLARPAPRPRRAVPPPPPARGGGERSHRGALALTGIALAALAAAIIALASGGGSSHPPATASTHRPTGSHAAARSGTPAASPTAPALSSAAATPAGGAGDPVSAVESFYHLAASHQYQAAWALADPAFQNQLGGYQSFQSGQAGDRSITFSQARVVRQTGNSATVAVQTVSNRTDGTHDCNGTVDVVRPGAPSWLLHQIQINCT